MRLRNALPALFSISGLLWAALSALDPLKPIGSLLGPLLALAAIALRYRQKRSLTAFVAAFVLASAWGIASTVLIEFRADSPSYFAYLRSAVFDVDFDFRNEWRHFRGEAAPSLDRRINVFSAGPALLWSPFYLAAHVYVGIEHRLGRDFYPMDGFSLPYLRSTLLGTLTVVILGGLLLVRAISHTRGFAIAILAVAGVFFASPVLYYTFFVPAMSHGVAFGLAAALVWAWDRARREPSWKAWMVLGGTLGLLAACRWQASVYGILVLLLAIEETIQKRARVSWLLSGAAAALLAFTPQLLAWKIGFDDWLALPHGPGFFDLSSPHWLDTLVSADHGFFNWTPLMLAGFVGLALGARESPLLHIGGLAVFGLTALINGSVPSYDWAAGDAFGARRYCEIVPLMAVGLGFAIDRASKAIGRAPLLAPAGLVALLILWNVGFISHFRARKYPNAAPLERLMKDQTRALRSAAREALGAVAGKGGRALAYDLFSAEYFYRGLNPSGTILLRDADERYLLSGWGTGSRRSARRTYRRALFPEACVAIPLEEPFSLRVAVSARAPDGLANQTLGLAANGRLLGSSHLGPDWEEIPFVVPAELLVRGENELCLRFGSKASENDLAVAALVEKIQLP